jgi:hypothetical protein
MDNYHFDGEGQLIDPTDENSIIKEYNDRKPLTFIILVGCVLVALLVLCGMICAVSTIILNLL